MWFSHSGKRFQNSYQLADELVHPAESADKCRGFPYPSQCMFSSNKVATRAPGLTTSKVASSLDPAKGPLGPLSWIKWSLTTVTVQQVPR